MCIRDRSKCDDVDREVGTAEMSRDDPSISAEQKLVKQADAHRLSTDRGSQGARSHRRRNNRTSRGGDAHFDKASASRDDQRHGQDWADDGSSRAEKETCQKNRGVRHGTRTYFHRETRPSNNQSRYDSCSVHVDSQTEVPSTRRDENEFGTRTHPAGFCVHHLPTSASSQLPTS